MPGTPHINLLPGCQKPANCYAKKGYLCATCHSRQSPTPVARGAGVLRIELSASRRRHLAEMAREAGSPIDVLASRLLAALIDDDAAAHGESVTG